MCTRAPIALSLYAVLSALLSPASVRVTAYVFVFVSFFSGCGLLPSVPHCPTLTARLRRRTATPREPRVQPRSRLAAPFQFSTIISGTIVIIFINAWTMTRREQGAHLTGLRRASGQCDWLVECRL